MKFIHQLEFCLGLFISEIMPNRRFEVWVCRNHHEITLKRLRAYNFNWTIEIIELVWGEMFVLFGLKKIMPIYLVECNDRDKNIEGNGGKYPL